LRRVAFFWVVDLSEWVDEVSGDRLPSAAPLVHHSDTPARYCAQKHIMDVKASIRGRFTRQLRACLQRCRPRAESW
jgi:hypothetical protein